MRKLILCSMLILALLAVSVAPAFAASYAYNGTAKLAVTSGKRTAGGFSVTQNINESTGGLVGSQVNYGARKTNTTSGDSIVTVINCLANGVPYNTSYISGAPAEGGTVWLVVSPRTVPVTGKWNISGAWQP